MNKKWNDYAQYRKSGIWNVYSFHFFLIFCILVNM